MNDLKYALRALAKSPVFAAIAVITLALGIGLNTAMFSLMNTIYLRPLPFEDSSALVRVYRATPGDRDGDLPAGDYNDLRSAEAAFGQFAGSSEENASVSGAGRTAEATTALRISSSYLGVLGIRPEIGRPFRAEEETPGRDRVVLISHALWAGRYGSAADIVGRTLRIGGETHTVVGVLPESANDGRVLRQIGILRPLAFPAAERASRTASWVRVIGRRSGSVSAAQGNAMVAAIGARLSREHPKEDGEASWRSVDLKGSTGNQRGRIMTAMLLGLSSCVLLIACSNLANFVLARAIERTHEITIRSALGASRLQLVRPLALESLVLAAAGGAAAVLVALWSTDWLSAQSLVSGGSLMQFPLDWRVLGFAVLSALATAFIFGTAPALLITRTNVGTAIKSGMRGASVGTRHRRLRSLLVIGQFAMAMTLLAGAGFLMRGAGALLSQRYGWDSGNVAVGSFDLPKARYDTPEKVLAFQRRLAGELHSIPGVDSVALAHGFPYADALGPRQYLVEGQERPAKGLENAASYDAVTPEYFRVTGIHLVDGRPFTDADNAGSAPVVIINKGMAHALFDGSNPIGRRIARADTDKPEWARIVGIASDVRPAAVYERPMAFQVYHPLAQDPWEYSMFAVRAQPGALGSVQGAIAAAASSADPDLPLAGLMSAEARAERSSFDLRMLEEMLGAFAFLGLSLAALGIYGVIARTVAQRTQEIGIRMALGATVADIRRLVLGSGIGLAIAGAVLGLAGATGVTRLLASVMPGIEGGGAAVAAGAMGVLALVALIASYLPARAASKVDPVAAIRSE